MPKHVAVIMDGNGRWAKKRLLNRIKGHEKGADAVRTIVRTARKLQIQALTLYAFSTENWQRPQTEISGLMHLLRRFLDSERQTLLENEIRLNAIGQVDRLPEAVRRDLDDVMAATAANRKMTLNLALSYGARAEIVDMVRQIAAAAKSGTLDPAAVTPDARLAARAASPSGVFTGWKQANWRPSTPSRRGLTSRHSGWAYRQRAAKAQPTGGSRRSGGRPGIGWSRVWLGR